jgi:hypothetical protein
LSGNKSLLQIDEQAPSFKVFMTAILIIELPKSENRGGGNSWQTFVAAVQNAPGGIGSKSRPAENVFVIDTKDQLGILASSVQSAEQCRLPYRVLFVENPEWIDWVHKS